MAPAAHLPAARGHASPSGVARLLLLVCWWKKNHFGGHVRSEKQRKRTSSENVGSFYVEVQGCKIFRPLSPIWEPRQQWVAVHWYGLSQGRGTGRFEFKVSNYGPFLPPRILLFDCLLWYHFNNCWTYQTDFGKRVSVRHCFELINCFFLRFKWPAAFAHLCCPNIWLLPNHVVLSGGRRGHWRANELGSARSHPIPGISGETVETGAVGSLLELSCCWLKKKNASKFLSFKQKSRKLFKTIGTYLWGEGETME